MNRRSNKQPRQPSFHISQRPWVVAVQSCLGRGGRAGPSHRTPSRWRAACSVSPTNKGLFTQIRAEQNVITRHLRSLTRVLWRLPAPSFPRAMAESCAKHWSCSRLIPRTLFSCSSSQPQRLLLTVGGKHTAAAPQGWLIRPYYAVESCLMCLLKLYHRHTYRLTPYN